MNQSQDDIERRQSQKILYKLWCFMFIDSQRKFQDDVGINEFSKDSKEKKKRTSTTSINQDYLMPFLDKICKSPTGVVKMEEMTDYFNIKENNVGELVSGLLILKDQGNSYRLNPDFKKDAIRVLPQLKKFAYDRLVMQRNKSKQIEILTADQKTEKQLQFCKNCGDRPLNQQYAAELGRKKCDICGEQAFELRQINRQGTIEEIKILQSHLKRIQIFENKVKQIENELRQKKLKRQREKAEKTQERRRKDKYQSIFNGMSKDIQITSEHKIIDQMMKSVKSTEPKYQKGGWKWLAELETIRKARNKQS